MECGCRGKNNRTNVRRHKVVRKYQVAGTYNKCGHCGRVEWLELNDALEIEMAGANYEVIRARVAAYG
jgi:hypothetical protein